MQVKICGLSTPETLEAAIGAKADMIGLNFHPKSPRFVSLEQAAVLAAQARGRTKVVALVVNAEDGLLAAIADLVQPDFWQFHGEESPARMAEVKSRFGLPIIRALGIGAPEDLARLREYAPGADLLLLDAKPPKDAAYPGGHGRPFDWSILSVLDRSLPFMLSGGLRPETVAGAIRAVRALGVSLTGVDVSSGVESAPGVKDGAAIAAFVAAARAA